MHNLLIQLIDNKSDLPIYHFAIIPFFSLRQYKNDKHQGVTIARVFPLVLVGLSIENNILTGFDVQSQCHIVIQKITNTKQLQKYLDWKIEFLELKTHKLIDHNWMSTAGQRAFNLSSDFALR